jgi:hypothetical protein
MTRVNPNNMNNQRAEINRVNLVSYGSAHSVQVRVSDIAMNSI